MPEKTTLSRRERSVTLSVVEPYQQIVRVHCGYCNTKRVYLIKDVITLLGDVPIYSMERAMKCDHCGRSDGIEARCDAVQSSDIGKLKIRRLVGIKMVRVPIWREDVF
jgi:hypothetical protein